MSFPMAISSATRMNISNQLSCSAKVVGSYPKDLGLAPNSNDRLDVQWSVLRASSSHIHANFPLGFNFAHQQPAYFSLALTGTGQRCLKNIERTN